MIIFILKEIKREITKWKLIYTKKIQFDLL